MARSIFGISDSRKKKKRVINYYIRHFNSILAADELTKDWRIELRGLYRYIGGTWWAHCRIYKGDMVKMDISDTVISLCFGREHLLHHINTLINAERQ